MILLDTGGLWAALDEAQLEHQACRAALVAARPPHLLSPFVLQELDYFLAQRVGVDAELALLNEVARGVYQLEPFDHHDVGAAHAIVTRYRDLDIGLADASLIVLAERHRCLDVLTLDRGHFSALRADGRPFRLVP